MLGERKMQHREGLLSPLGAISSALERPVPHAANFRDVSEACEVALKPGQIFRSSEVYG